MPSLGRLPKRVRKALAAARRAARERGERLYLVGGVVRDLLLHRRIRDLDVVVEGDAAALAEAVGFRLGGSVLAHGRFGTATLTLPDGGTIDFATSRRETYAHPGALPRVERAGIEDDLRRRDFTINALAIQVAPSSRPRLLDPFGGARDLARGRLRFLHGRSPFDDPTRAFRAVRYAHRLGFVIDPESARAIGRALESGAFEAVSGDRLRREISLLFSEPGAAGAARRLAGLGLTAPLGARSGATRAALARLRRAEHAAGAWPEASGWPLFLLAWLADRPASELTRVAARLGATGDAGRALSRWGKTRRLLPGLARSRLASQTRRLLAGLTPVETAALSVCLAPKAAERVLAAGHGSARLMISGKDLVKAGVAPGPSIGRALEETLDARLDGRLSAREELAWASRRARELGGRS